MRKLRLVFLLVFCSTVLFSGCMWGISEGELPGGDHSPIMVDVMLQEAEGITITGQNPVSVEAGGEVSFAVQVKDGYKIESVGQGATYENGVVTLSEVKFPTTVELETRPLRDLQVHVTNNDWQGTLTATAELGTVKEDTELTLSVDPKDGVLFLGYSIGADRTRGGTIVSTSTEYTFTVTEDVTLYANYYNVGSGRLVIYDSNGGKESPQYSVFADSSPYIGPNALANKGQFTRDGYVLYGYNTKPDGSGTYYGTGWSVILPEDKDTALTLYAQWLPVTETEAFTYKVNANNTVTITKYRGDHETVVIPETIEGLPVTAIAARTFVNCKFKTLYLSRNLQTVESAAVANCRSFTTLYFCDTPSAISDDSFLNCSEFQHLYMLACIDPHYSTSNNGTYKMKYQRLLTAEGKKIIFHAGSNVSYGVDIATIQKELGGEYAGVNFGCNQGTSAVFFVEVAVAHMNAGDLVVLCPEIHAYQYGRNDINTTTWQIFEGAYNAFADVDIRHFTAVFKSFASFNTNRYSSTPRTYEQFNTASGAPSVSKFGDYNINHTNPTNSWKETVNKYLAQGGYSSGNMDPGLLSQSYNQYLNRAIDMVNAKGGKVYISFAATMKQWLNKESQTVARQTAYKNAVIRAFPKAVVISDPGTYVLDHTWFYNSAYHVTTSGSVHRAKLLAKDILAQLAKEK